MNACLYNNGQGSDSAALNIKTMDRLGSNTFFTETACSRSRIPPLGYITVRATVFARDTFFTQFLVAAALSTILVRIITQTVVRRIYTEQL